MKGFHDLEPEKYNPLPALDEILSKAQANMDKDSNSKNCLLAGALVSQMLEVLYPDNIFPEAYDNALLTPTTRENYRLVLEKAATSIEGPHYFKNVATFYKLTDDNGNLLSEGPDGKELPCPQMNEESLATILSTAALVTESVITQYLVHGALLHKEDEYLPMLRKIEDILEKPGLTDQLLAQGKTILESGGKFGRQHPCNQPMLDLLRQDGSPNRIIINALRASDLEDARNNPQLENAVLKLRQIGVLLQESKSLSAAERHSNGLCAGLDAVIGELYPEKYARLPKIERINPLSTERVPFQPVGITPEECLQQSPLQKPVIGR